MRIACISILVVIFSLKVSAQSAGLSGIISDDKGNHITFVSVWVDSIHKGTFTNEEGAYRLNLDPGIYTVDFRSPGFLPLVKTINIERSPVTLDIQLSRVAGTNLSVDNADAIISQVIARQNIPGKPAAYSGTLYSRELQRLTAVPKKLIKNIVAYQMHMSPDRKGIINFSESLASFKIPSKNYDGSQITAGIITKNSRDIFNFNKVPELHIDFYQNNLYLNGFNEHAFISPLSARAIKYYRYKLIAQFTDHSYLIDKISVSPMRKDEHLFSGTIYIVDKEWLLYAAELRLSLDAHIDFIDSVSIHQQYVPVADGNWLTQAMQFNYYGNFLGFKYSGLLLHVYQDIHPDTLKKESDVAKFYYPVKDYRKDNRFWEQNRPLILTHGEEKLYTMGKPAAGFQPNTALTDSLQRENNRFRLLPYLLWGYTISNYNNSTSISIPSPFNTFFYNTVEGWGADFKVKYTHIYERQKNLSIIPNIRYGFADHQFNANVLANYVYNSFRKANVYMRAGTDFLDLNNTGSLSLFLNSLSTLYFGNNYLKLYQSRFVMAGTSGEIANGVLLNGEFEYANRNSLFNTTTHTFNRDSVAITSNNPIDPNSKTPLFPHYRALTLRGSVTFTFNQQYAITPEGKFILAPKYPILRLNYRKGIPAFGSVADYDMVSADVFMNGLKMGIYGYSAFLFSAGKFLNTRNLYYPDYYHFHGGQSFFYDASSGGFHFLNYYTYSTDKAFFEAHAEHNFTGILFSRVPLIKKLHLEEIIGGSYLAQGTLPAYQEVYVGVKRTLIRLDYGLAFGKFTKLIQGFRLTYNFPGL
ncbi:DUF5686 family protein [Mucilaginibacter gotjawali]|uniref:Cna protein B-type domain protein n=1 Tax=Mucilaginibacter gotjawali TaxID=1550579 RepID=A0A839SJW0_9SPHI|nr:DUF5686 family protein [Mucilaginibacter gotjawali]MBB3056777.1 hypothetical protein [Mucilaginibacter gotjawali]